MKRVLLAFIALSGAMTCLAQDTTAKEKADTIRVGGMIIIKEGKGDNDGKNTNVIISNKNKRKSSNISTNWGILDFGFSNFNDNTDYAAARASGFIGQDVGPDQFDLRTGKSVNINIWFFYATLKRCKTCCQFKVRAWA